MPQVRFTKTQRDECRHKLSIMEEGLFDMPEGCMAQEYGLDEASLDALTQKFYPKGYKDSKLFIVVELNEVEAKALHGELGNAMDIADDNTYERNDEYARAAASYKDGRARIAAAFPGVQF